MADRAIDTTPHAVKPVEDCLDALHGEGTLVLTAHKDRPVPDFENRLGRKGLTVRGAEHGDPLGQTPSHPGPGQRKYDLSKVHTHTMPIDQLDRAMRILGGEVAGEEAVHITVTPEGS